MSAGKHVKASVRKKRTNGKALWIGLILLLLLGGIVLALALIPTPDSWLKDEAEALPTVEMESPKPIELQQRADACYERWLAASMALGLSMRCADFDIQNIWLTGETAPEARMQSGGVYMQALVDGETKYLFSQPLDKERSETGTVDLYSADLGFASFDFVDPGAFDASSCTAVDMSELEVLISQSLLVSVYEH